MARALLLRAGLHQALEDYEQLKVDARSDCYEGNQKALEGLKRIAEEAP